MKIEFLPNTSWFNMPSKRDLVRSFEPTNVVLSTDTIEEQPKHKARFDIKLLGFSLLSVVPWADSAKDKIHRPTTINKGLKKRAQPHEVVENGGGRANSLRFRPYVSKVPWHTGARAFLSQLFPRYGHYCGPNWSSGKDGGSPLWDKRPIDWLDYCCYCHDIGYDTHDQAKLLESDLAFLDCLERKNMATRGDAHIAHIYKTMCITGKLFMLGLHDNYGKQFFLKWWCGGSRYMLSDDVWSWLIVLLCFALIYGRSQEYFDTIQNVSRKAAVSATFDPFWMAEQFQMEKLEVAENLNTMRVPEK